jgi:hypothetical protein
MRLTSRGKSGANRDKRYGRSKGVRGYGASARNGQTGWYAAVMDMTRPVISHTPTPMLGWKYVYFDEG